MNRPSFHSGFRMIVLPFVLLMLAVLLLRRATTEWEQPANYISVANSNSSTPKLPARSAAAWKPLTTFVIPDYSDSKKAEQIVRERLSRFARERRGLAEVLAQRYGGELSEEMKAFFDAVEANDFPRADELFKRIEGTLRLNGGWPPNSKESDRMIWHPILETYGAFEAIQQMPPQSVLAFGDVVLNSAAPNSVLFGGTDAGRFISTMLNETSDGAKRVILTQNALADTSYLEYVQTLYGNQLNWPSQQEEDVIMEKVKQQYGKVSENGTVEVSGPDPVFSFAADYVRKLIEKNPDLFFSLEESIPMESTYAGAGLSGGVLTLDSKPSDSGISAETAAQSATYWKELTQWFMSDTQMKASDSARNSFGKLGEAHANVLAHNQRFAEALSIVESSRQLVPHHEGLAEKHAELLSRVGRDDQARQIAKEFYESYPERRVEAEKVLKRFLESPSC